MDLLYATDNTTLYNTPSVVALGSSTFYGTGASNPSTTSAIALISSWLKTNSAGGAVSTNLAVPGYSTNDIIPGNGNTNFNVEKAASLNPSFVILGLPTNDAAINTTTQWLNNLILIDNYLKARGIVLLVEGTQPRNTYTAAQDQELSDMNTLIGNYFGNRFVNVLNLLRDNTSSSPAVYNPIYNSGDGIHPNDAGHQIIANQFISVMKSYFIPNTNSNWAIEYSSNGTVFYGLTTVPVSNLKTNLPLDARYYRVRAKMANGTYGAYSNISQYLGIPAGTPVPPIANAGAWNFITLPGQAVFNATASQASKGTLSFLWTKISGPSGDIILNPNAAITNISFTQAGFYTYQVQVTDTNGLTATATASAQVSGQAPPPPPSPVSTYINFGDNAHIGPSPWNNTGYTIGSGSKFNLLDQNGNASGIMTLLSNFTSAPSSGVNTGNNSGIYPDAVISSSFAYTGTDTAKIQISGLNPNNLYNFTFFTSWSHPWSGAITNFGIGSALLPLDGSNNSTNTVSIKGVAPNSNGLLVIKVLKDSNAPVAYINAIVFQAYSSGSTPPPPTPVAPTLLTAHGNSLNTVSLKWVGAANASLYYIYRSSVSSGPFSLIDSVSGSQTSYTNTGLPSNTVYFYQLKTKNSNGLSLPGNIAYASTLQSLVEVQFDSDQPAGSPWNSFNGTPALGQSLTNLTTTNGTNSGIAITITHNFDGSNVLGAVTGVNSGIYPDKVIRGQFYVQSPDSAMVQLSGLSLSQSYDLAFFNSWGNPFSTGNTSFTAGGITVNLNAANNSTNTVQINNLIPNPNGQILVTIKAAPSSVFGIISALVIGAHSIPPNLTNVSVGLSSNSAFAFAPNIESPIADAIVYPVPFSTNLHVNLQANNSGWVKMSLLDLRGRTLIENPIQILDQGTNSTSLIGNLSGIPKGIYILKIESDVFATKTIKVNKL